MPTRKRNSTTRMLVRLPERDLAESILDLAKPLFESLGSEPPIADRRRAIAFAIDVWNAHVAASKVWGAPKPKALAELRKSAKGEDGPRSARFELLSERWREHFWMDPRVVSGFHYEADDKGQSRLICEVGLLPGVEAEVPPPTEKRIAIAGRFLDEVRIRLSSTSFVGYPVDSHRGVIDGDGRATIHTKMPIALQLFAEGSLSRVGGAPIEVVIGGVQLDPMALSEVRVGGLPGRDDIAVLVFEKHTT